MKRSKIISVITLLLAGLLVYSCQDFLDVNDDPNTTTEATEALRLAGLLGEFSYNIIGSTGTRFPVLWMQQIAFNGTPPTEDNYDINATDINGVWGAAYSDAMINSKQLAEVAAENGNHAYVAIGKTILAWTAVFTSNLWGDIPFSEALKGQEDINPAYDSQESVYMAAQTLLDEAIAALEQPSILTPAEDDLLYGGDMTKWKRLIYTLKARWHMNLSRAPGYNAEEQAQKALTALQQGFQSNADDAQFKYYTVQGEENPWYQFAIDGKWFDRHRLSTTYVQLLKGLDDPRLPIQARPNANGEYQGHENGEPPVTNSLISEIGVYYSAKDAYLYWLTYAEAKFMEAEATFILQGAAAAEPIWRDAITASMEKLGVSAADQTAYMSSLPSLTASNAHEQIIVQKYIANFLNVQVYNDWRRTGYPELTIIDDPYVDVIPLRFVVPNDELDNNLENLQATGIPLGQEAMTVPVWWDSAGQ